MRARIAILVIALTALALLNPARALATATVPLAQDAQEEQPQEEEDQGEEEGGTTEDAPEESGTGEGAVEEEGPLWTYQMARMALLGLLPLILAIAFWYYRFVASRARES